jgi:SAM-dependent methyltransferase
MEEEATAVPFDHNDRYHRLLLRQVPEGCRTALDVGCGTGRFARRLARRGIQVDAVDRSAEVIEAARAAGGGARYLQADITRMELPAGRYDYIACLASIHHVPFATVASLREALAPGGVLAVLGCYRQSTAADFAVFLVAAPVNAAARVAVAAVERARRGGTGDLPRPPVTPAAMTLGQVREAAAALLPGCAVRRLLLWRYLLVFRRPQAP